MTCAIVERMAVLDEDFSIDARLTEGGDGLWSPPGSTPAVAPRDFQSLYEQQRARAEAAEARCEELRWTEVAARSDAGSWKSRFKSCRRRLSEAEEEAKELRSAARDVPSLRAQVVRLEALLSEAGTRSSEAALVGALSKEVARLHDALAASPARRGGAGRQSAGDPRGQAVERVRRPLPLPRIQDPGRRPDALRRPRPKRLAPRHARLLHRRLEARRVLRRSRRQKATIKSLARKNARLRKAAKSARTGREKAEARRATGSSDGRLRSARRTSPWWSTTRGS